MTTVFEDAVLRLSRFENLVIAAWFDAPEVHHMLEVEKSALAVGSLGALLANVAVRGRPRFSDDVRREAVRMSKAARFRLGVAHIVLADGLTGSAARAFLSMVVLVSRPSNPVKVCGEIEEGAAFLAACKKAPTRKGEIALAIGAAIA